MSSTLANKQASMSFDRPGLMDGYETHARITDSLRKSRRQHWIDEGKRKKAKKKFQTYQSKYTTAQLALDDSGYTSGRMGRGSLLF
jgi:hypothetical protein